MTKSDIHNHRTVAGAGYIALDLVLNSRSPSELKIQRRAGGTCGNVLAILSFLGLEAVPIARLGADKAADMLISDLETVGVNCKYLEQDSAARTPRVIEFLPNQVGGTHRFGFSCPLCKGRFPRRTEPVFDRANRAFQSVKPDLFFFDRAGPSTVKLAAAARNAGALVVFEPDTYSSSDRFRHAVEVSHILKYSSQRIGGSVDHCLFESVATPTLIVETMGGNGLKYIARHKGLDPLSWVHQPPYPVASPVDQAGAGDWCTAGLIARLLAASPRVRWHSRTIRRALAFGQAIAAASTLFPSARGYLLSESRRDVMRAAVHTLRFGQLPDWIGSDVRIRDQPIRTAKMDGTCAICFLPRHE